MISEKSSDAQAKIRSPIVADFSEISSNPFKHAQPESTTLKLSSDDFGEIIYSQTNPRLISEKSPDAQAKIRSPIVADFSEISSNPFNHAQPESATLKGS